METKLLMVAMLLCIATSFSQTTYVPDDNFEQALIDLGYDDVLDDNVLTANIESISFLNVSNKNIQNLTGLDDFKAITELNLSNNNLSSNSITNATLLKLDISNNSFDYLDLTSLNSLQELYCANNQITKIYNTYNQDQDFLSFAEILKGGAFTHLDVSNNKIQLLNLSTLTELISFNGNNNDLYELKVKNGNNENFVYFSAINNEQLNCIEVDNEEYSNLNWTDIDSKTSFNTDCSLIDVLTYVPDIYFEANLISQGYDATYDKYVQTRIIEKIENLSLDGDPYYINSLEGIEDFKALNYLFLKEPRVIDLDFSQNQNLDTLYVIRGGNYKITSPSLKSIHLQRVERFNYDLTSCPNLTNFILEDSGVDGVDLSKNSLLKELYIVNGDIPAIDVTKNTLLEVIEVNGSFSEIDLSKNTVLTNLNLSRNKLDNLDLSKNTQLINLNVSFNYLTNLDLSNNLLLQNLDCAYNFLENLNSSLNSNLESLQCYNNNLTNLNVKNGNNTNFTIFSAINNTNLTCINVDNVTYSTTNWTEIDPQTSFSEDCSTLSTDNYELSGFKVYPNPIKSNVMVTLDKEATYSLISISGLIIQKGILQIGDTELNVSQLANGLYFLNIKTDNGIISKKLIKL